MVLVVVVVVVVVVMVVIVVVDTTDGGRGLYSRSSGAYMHWCSVVSVFSSQRCKTKHPSIAWHFSSRSTCRHGLNREIRTKESDQVKELMTIPSSGVKRACKVVRAE